MKHTLLATTALVAMTGAAAAEITISGSARIGMRTTEGAAAIAAGTVFGKGGAQTLGGHVLTALEQSSLDVMGGSASIAGVYDVGEYNLTTTIVTFTSTAIAAEITKLDLLIANAKALIATNYGSTATAAIDTAAEKAKVVADLAFMENVRGQITAKAASAAVAKKSDTTTGLNRVRISFAGSGETDGGLTYGFSARADHSDTSTGGSQYISGAFGKISMGDLNGGDEQMTGNLSGVGFSGAGSHQEYGYQSSDHNIGYSVSMAGVSFAATTDLVRGADPAKTGSNSAMGIKWSGDMGGATVGVAVGTSKIGKVSEDSISASVSMGGLSIMAVSHTNDNGAAVAAVTEAAATTTKAHVFAVAKVDNFDTDTTGLSISYAMDAMSVTAFTRTESTSGVADKDYSGIGFAYNMGGATLKAGFVDRNDISIMDFGLNFSF
jgi:outer membrane protein OmpU